MMGEQTELRLNLGVPKDGYKPRVRDIVDVNMRNGRTRTGRVTHVYSVFATVNFGTSPVQRLAWGTFHFNRIKPRAEEGAAGESGEPF